MANILRWILGYVSFTAEGGFTERFLNLCKIHGVELWNVSNDGVKVCAITSRQCFEKLGICLENSGMELKIQKEKGLPCVLSKYKYRFGIVLGIAAAGLFVSLMSCFVWSIEVAENNAVKLENFTQALADEGVKVGALKSQIDILEVQQRLLDKYPSLSWISINIFGSKVQVEYTHIKKNQPMDDTVTPKNIVASKKGKIVLVEGYRGKNEVKEGDYVAEGTLLISGVTLNGDLSENFVHASGKVYALTENKTDFSLKSTEKKTLVGEVRSMYSLKLLGGDIPLGIKPKDGYITLSESFLKGNETLLPIGFARRDSFTFIKTDIDYTTSQSKLLLLEKAITNKRGFYEEVEIKDISYSFYRKNNKFGLTYTIKCVENIAVEKKVLVEEN